MGSLVIEAFARSMIEQIYDSVNIFLVQFTKAHRLREERSNESVGILIRSTFPRMVRESEVHFHRELLLRFLMEGELRTIVVRAGFSELLRTVFLELFRRNSAHSVRRAIFHLSSDEISGFPFSKRSDRLFLAPAYDGIALPMAECVPSIDARGPRIDHAFVGNQYLLEFLLPPAFFP